MELDQFINHYKNLFEKKLLELFKKSKQEISLENAARYILLAPSKRIRPLLSFALMDAFEKDPLDAMPIALAIEMIHTYTLIHDDLPCMDNDKIRRGQKAVHIAYKEAVALLTGNYLLTESFTLINKASYEDKIKIKLIDLITKYCGKDGVLQGQMSDLFYEKEKIDQEALFSIYQKKTSSLFTLALLSIASLITIPSEKTEKLEKIGSLFGIAFQMNNDLKSSSSDMRNDKITSITLFSINGVREKIFYLVGEITSLLGELDLKNDLLHQIVKRTLFQNAYEKGAV